MRVDRKARIREYKETPRTAGVFRVRHAASGAAVVGSSVDVPAMLNRQRAQLRMGVHPDRALQAAWNEAGEAAFEFEVLDTLTPPADRPDWNPADELRELEALWRERIAGGADA